MSSRRSILCGLPQGQSDLGPFLFIINVNYLLKVAEDSVVVLFADDTTICNAETNFCDSFDSSLNKVDGWFKTNGISDNPVETQIRKFGGIFSNDYLIFWQLC